MCVKYYRHLSDGCFRTYLAGASVRYWKLQLYNNPVLNVIKDPDGEYADIASADALDDHTSN